MLLTITTTAPNASDIGYLLHKNPATLFERELAFGIVHVFYTEATDESCTIAFQLEIDPIRLVRGKAEPRNENPLAQYVSTRPYLPSSFLSVALAETFRSALNGMAKERAERVTEKMPLSATVYAMPGNDGLLRSLFVPLGYTVQIIPVGFKDERFPEWGDSGLCNLMIAGQVTVRELLTHLYVLIPVLDNTKHYFIGDDEVDKLLKRGEGWLATHPEKELITERYLRYRRRLTDAALTRLVEVEEIAVPETLATREEEASQREEHLETPVRLNDLRIQATVAAVQSLEPRAKRVIDLGCGEGRTIAALLTVSQLSHVAGMDVSPVALERAARRLHLERLNERERERVSLFQGSLVYRDRRITDYDVALLNEVIEHLDEDRLVTLERVVFQFARPRRVIVTTPNADYNSVWPALPAGKFRHADHRFEWTQAQFLAWATHITADFGYEADISGVGPEDHEGDRGQPTQMVIFDLPSAAG